MHLSIRNVTGHTGFNFGLSKNTSSFSTLDFFFVQQKLNHFRYFLQKYVWMGEMSHNYAKYLKSNEAVVINKPKNFFYKKNSIFNIFNKYYNLEKLIIESNGSIINFFSKKNKLMYDILFNKHKNVNINIDNLENLELNFLNYADYYLKLNNIYFYKNLSIFNIKKSYYSKIILNENGFFKGIKFYKYYLFRRGHLSENGRLVEGDVKYTVRKFFRNILKHKDYKSLKGFSFDRRRGSHFRRKFGKLFQKSIPVVRRMRNYGSINRKRRYLAGQRISTSLGPGEKRRFGTYKIFENSRHLRNIVPFFKNNSIQGFTSLVDKSRGLYKFYGGKRVFTEKYNTGISYRHSLMRRISPYNYPHYYNIAVEFIPKFLKFKVQKNF